MIFDEMACKCGEWLKGSGPESDIVMSSRIRLARNLANYPFIRRCNDFDRVNIESSVRERLSENGKFDDFTFINVAELDGLDRQLLVNANLSVANFPNPMVPEVWRSTSRKRSA